MKNRKRLGELLIESGKITREHSLAKQLTYLMYSYNARNHFGEMFMGTYSDDDE